MHFTLVGVNKLFLPFMSRTAINPHHCLINDDDVPS
jgi:hypothetical protein